MQVIADMLKTNLNIDVDVEVREFQVLIPEFQRMDFDLLRVGSGGDFDPDDGLIDIMITDGRLNGRDRNKDEMPFGFFGEAEVDRLSAAQSTTTDLEERKALVQAANKITSDKVATAFIYHPVNSLIYRKEVNFPAVSRIVGLVDLDRVSIA